MLRVIRFAVSVVLVCGFAVAESVPATEHQVKPEDLKPADERPQSSKKVDLKQEIADIISSCSAKRGADSTPIEKK